MAWFQKRDTDKIPDKRPGIIQEQLDRHLQDHLSGVVKFDCPHCKHQTLAFDAFYQFAKSFRPVPFGDDSMSWEQLWLAFVMHEKYDKAWGGEDWAKEA